MENALGISTARFHFIFDFAGIFGVAQHNTHELFDDSPNSIQDFPGLIAFDSPLNRFAIANRNFDSKKIMPRNIPILACMRHHHILIFLI